MRLTAEERAILKERVDLARRARLALSDDPLIVGRIGQREARILRSRERQERLLREARYPRKLTQMELSSSAPRSTPTTAPRSPRCPVPREAPASIVDEPSGSPHPAG